jgi:hypothetical protein
VAAAKPPRGLVLATGEEVPQGASVRARMLILEVGAGDVNVGVLSESQELAAQGVLAESMGGYVRWLAGRLDEARQELRMRVGQLVGAAQRGAHARTAGIVAELQAGFEQFLAFAAGAGALGSCEQGALASRCWRGLVLAANHQAGYQFAADPALRYLALLRIALATGEAHVADRRGRMPAEPEAWGWQQKDDGWEAAGVRIGWLDGEELLLHPSVSYAVAQAIAGTDRIAQNEQALRGRLHRQGLLASVDKARQTLKVRRQIEGAVKHVLDLRIADFRGPQAPTVAPL